MLSSTHDEPNINTLHIIKQTADGGPLLGAYWVVSDSNVIFAI